jgi:hypothetical protein
LILKINELSSKLQNFLKHKKGFKISKY